MGGEKRRRARTGSFDERAEQRELARIDEERRHSTAILLVRAGRDDDEVIASLIDWLDLSIEEATAALHAARNAPR